MELSQNEFIFPQFENFFHQFVSLFPEHEEEERKKPPDSFRLFFARCHRIQCRAGSFYDTRERKKITVLLFIYCAANEYISIKIPFAMK